MNARSEYFRKRFRNQYYQIPYLSHGDWVGLGWSDGRIQSSVISYNPPRDAFDATAKDHDAAYAKGTGLRNADFNFAIANIGRGIKRTAAGLAVGAQGIIRPDSNMPALRGTNHGVRTSPYNLRTRRPQPVTPDTPLLSLPAPPTMPMISGANLRSSSRGGNDGEEVPIKPIITPPPKVIPNYYTVECPHELIVVLNPFNYKETNSNIPFQIRLNSIYDPIVGALSDTQPQGRDTWAALFKYYRVLSCDVTVTLANGAIQGNDGNGRFHHFIWGYELVDQSLTVCGTRGAFLTAKHCKRSMITPAGSASYWNTTVGAQRNGVTHLSYDTLSFHYDPNNWDYHVQEKGSEERWTPVGSNPSIDHDLAFRIFHCSTVDPDSNSVAFTAYISVNYTVQFMEENESLYKIRDSTVATYPDASGVADI
jgi:hypothetical protein